MKNSRKVGYSMDPIQRQELPLQLIEFIGELKSLRFPKQGCTSDVAVAEGAKGIYIVKRTKGEQYSSYLAHEAQVIESLETTDLPVPKLYKYIEQDEQAWALMEYIPGESVGEAVQGKTDNQKEDILFQFGEILAKTHATPCPQDLKKDQPWLENMLETAQYHLDRYEVDGTQELLNQLKRTKPNPFPQTLIHGDYTIDNVLVRNGKIVGIIDWSGGAFGDPRYDASLAIRPKPGIFENERDREIFIKGYGKNIVNVFEYEYFESGLYEFC